MAEDPERASCRATGGLISTTTAIRTDKKVSGLAMAGHFAPGGGPNCRPVQQETWLSEQA